MKNKNLVLIISVIILIILLIFVVFLGEKKLDINSDKIKNLHASLGEVDTNKCGGLITYSDKTMTESDLDIENRLCKSYYAMNIKDIITEVTKETIQNENDNKICKVGEKTTLATTDEKESECSYKIIENNILNEVYTDIYGTKMTEKDSFYISDKEACYKEGERYYCGKAENYKVSIIPNTTIFRMIDKAIESSNGEIIIYDYFLKISNNICYYKNNSEKNNECSEELKKIDINNTKETMSLIKKYGTIYKHTFKEGKNDSYYWFKTELN